MTYLLLLLQVPLGAAGEALVQEIEGAEAVRFVSPNRVIKGMQGKDDRGGVVVVAGCDFQGVEAVCGTPSAAAVAAEAGEHYIFSTVHYITLHCIK
jgi:hypothetical protein